jgi:glycosyltransferase involved in cell wall biosynthesis
MRLAIVGNANSIHIQKLVQSMASRGIYVLLITAHKCGVSYSSNIILHELKIKAPLGYFLDFLEVKKIIRKHRIDLVNVHYATGYATLVRFSACKPILVSVWGSDIYDFPRKSIMHKLLVKKNLMCASAIASTSHCMLREVDKLYKHPDTYVTYFGVDTDKFCIRRLNGNAKTSITIGIVKGLYTKYGVDTLIKAFSIVNIKLSSQNIRLLIVGEGPERKSLENLTIELGVEHLVAFLGPIPNDEIPNVIHEMDIFVALSRLDSESFGVAIVEAGACGKPSIVSDVSGFKEVVINEITGLIVERENENEAAEAIIRLIEDKFLREKIGAQAREHVVNNYSLNDTIDNILNVYENVVTQYDEK